MPAFSVCARPGSIRGRFGRTCGDETVRILGGARIGLVAGDRESRMKWRVVVELARADGAVQRVGGTFPCPHPDSGALQ
jgi:hypothetical protein